MTKHRVTRRLLAVALSVLLVLGCRSGCRGDPCNSTYPVRVRAATRSVALAFPC